MIFLIRGPVTSLLVPTLTRHLGLHLRRSETPLETNSGYATVHTRFECLRERTLSLLEVLINIDFLNKVCVKIYKHY